MPYSHPQWINRATALREVRHLLPGALLFAGLAGYVNAVAVGFFSTPVSHMTGAVSHLGVDVAEARGWDSLASFSIVLGFLAGAVAAGMTIGAKKLMPGRRYGVALICEGLLLGVATWLLLERHRLGLPLVAMACGLQNAMTSSYCGLLIRSTHITGTVTDIGVMLGHWIRHRRVEKWKLAFLSSVVGAFGVGGWLGASLDLRFGPACLAVAASGCVVAGIALWLAIENGWMRRPELVPEPRSASFPGL